MSGAEVAGQMDLSCTDHVSLHPAGAPRRGLRRLPERTVSHWDPGIVLCPALACTHLYSPPPPLPLSPIPPSPPHLAKHPKRWPSPQGSGQPPGLTMAQTTSWSMGRPCQMSVPGMDACRKCNSTALMQLCIQDLAAMSAYFHLIKATAP